MIKASDLRIGNLVHGFKTVWAIDGTEFTKTDPDTGMLPFDPIPLTEEWLLRFGFKWLGADHYENIAKYRIDSIGSKYFFCSPMICSSKFQFVHQLQNLYYAPTSHELQPTEPVNQK